MTIYQMMRGVHPLFTSKMQLQKINEVEVHACFREIERQSSRMVPRH